MGENHVYYNGNSAKDFVTPSGLTGCPDKLPPLAYGVLLDMAKLMGKDILLKEPPLTAKK